MGAAARHRILVVDDDRQIRQDLRAYFERRGYAVGIAEDGYTALDLAKTMEPDLVVLDITFPESASVKKRTIDGLEVLRRLRDSDDVPVLMLSSTTISAVKVMALSLGADDYVTKPFEIEELDARIEAVLRRARDEVRAGKVVEFSRLRLDPNQRRVWKDGVVVNFTGLEFDILYTLARRPNHVFTRERLLQLAWKEFSYSVAKSVDVHIGHIRKKIEDDPAHPTFLVTVRGAGYRFEDTPA